MSGSEAECLNYGSNNNVKVAKRMRRSTREHQPLKM